MSTTSFDRWTFALLAASIAGCAEQGDGLPREAVSGTVTFDGKPLAKGLIQLLPVAGSDSTPLVGTIVENGAFSIPKEQGPVPGTYKVSITAGSGTEAPAEELPGVGKAPKKDLVPPRYNLKTTLEAKVAAGAPNTFDFPLTTK